MAFKNPEFSSNSPYYDDFEETKNFLKILFKPGYAVQARELTQLQTILQSQVAHFADHIFQDGSQVFGGKIQILSTPYIRLEKNTYDTIGVTSDSTDTYLSSLGTNLLKVFSKSGSVFTELATIKVSYFDPSGYSTNDDYSIAFYNVVSVADDQNGTFDMQRDYYLGVTSSGPFVNVINPSIEVGTSPEQYTINPYGEGLLATIDQGIFYIDGYFVRADKQTVALFKGSLEDESELTVDSGLSYTFANKDVRLFSKPSQRIGYEITRDVVTATQDNTLKDPARGFYNYNAPGADRYRISLTLKSLDYDTQSVDIENFVSTDFIQLLRTTNGVVDYIKDKSSYAQILELFAKRTQDESGSYTVKPFLSDVKNHLRKDRYKLALSSAANTLFFDKPTANVQKSSATPTSNNVTIKIGGYIWPSTNPTFNPFSVASFANVSFAVAKVVDVIPDYDTTANLKSIKIVVELQNNKRLSADRNVRYYFRQTNTSGNVLLTATSTEVAIDSKGAYSLLDSPVGDDTKLAITVQSGKAYVYGYEYETFAPRVVDYLKNGNQDSVKSYTGLNVNFELGNYVYGSFAVRDNNQVNDIDFETLPSLELVDIDTNTILIYPNTESQVKSRILAWAPFKSSSDDTIGDMIDLVQLNNAENTAAVFPHESVIFVEVAPEPA